MNSSPTGNVPPRPGVFVAMQHLFRSLVLTVLAASAAGQEAFTRVVPPDSKLVVWLDVEGLSGLVGRDLLRGTLFSGKSDWLQRLREEWRFDPIADIEAVALFGLEDQISTLALLTNERIDGVLERLAKQGALETVESAGVELSHVHAGKLATALGIDEPEATSSDAEAYLHRRRVEGRAGREGRRLLLGEHAAAVRDAAKSLDANERAGRRDPALRPGCMLFVAMPGPFREIAGDDPRGKIASKTKTISGQLSEQDGEVHLTMRLETDEAKDARQLAAVVNGVKALATLLAPEADDVPEELLEALQSAQARAEGKAVTFDVSVPSSLIKDAVRARDGKAKDDKDKKR